MSCPDQSHLSKYQKRPSPPRPANDVGCRGARNVLGNDGRLYDSVKRGRMRAYRWVLSAAQDTPNATPAHQRAQKRSRGDMETPTVAQMRAVLKSAGQTGYSSLRKAELKKRYDAVRAADLPANSVKKRVPCAKKASRDACSADVSCAFHEPSQRCMTRTHYRRLSKSKAVLKIKQQSQPAAAAAAAAAQVPSMQVFAGTQLPFSPSPLVSLAGHRAASLQSSTLRSAPAASTWASGRASEFARHAPVARAQPTLVARFLQPTAQPSVQQAMARGAPVRIGANATLSTWLDAAARFPAFDSSSVRSRKQQAFQSMSRADFEAVQARLAREFYQQTQFSNARNWLDGEMPRVDRNHDPIFVRRLVVPRDACLYLIGDLHSSLSSALNILRHLRDVEHAFVSNNSFALRNNVYLVFLGDIVDRGPYSVELLALVAQLHLQNGNQVVVINGNHEDCDVFIRYGLAAELSAKYDVPVAQAATVTNFLHYLPSAVFVQFGVERDAPILQLCHGAITNRRDEVDKMERLLRVPVSLAQTGVAQPQPSLAFFRYSQLHVLACGTDQARLQLEQQQPDINEQFENDVDNLKWGDFNGRVDGVQMSKRGAGVLEFGRDAVQAYLRRLRLTAILSGHQDLSNVTLLTPSAQPASAKLELDAEYGLLHGLHRPHNYAALGNQSVEFAPGVDFLALNTSSAHMSKGSEASLKYDCYLRLSF